MKLLFCPLCEDIVKLALAHEDYRTCTCGKSCGKYMTHEHAIYGGHAIPIGINNNAFILAMSNHLVTFEGWFYPPKGKGLGISSRHIHFLKGATDGKRPER